MNLEEQVTNLELSKKIKELGVKQDSLFYWFKSFLDDKISLTFFDKTMFIDNKTKKRIICSAFTVAELGEMLHERFNEWAQGWDDSGCYYHFQFGLRGAGSMMSGVGETFGADTDKEADARAELLIHLIENSLLKLDEINPD